MPERHIPFWLLFLWGVAVIAFSLPGIYLYRKDLKQIPWVGWFIRKIEDLFYWLKNH